MRFSPRTLIVIILIGASWAPHAQAQWGTLKMTFRLEGKAPARMPLNVNGMCAANRLVDETLTVGPEGGIKNVVVSLISTDTTKVHPQVQAAAKRPVQIDNRKCRFEPRVLVVAVNQPLVLKNSDEFGHNTKVTPFDNEAFNPIIPAGGQLEHRFFAAETTPTPIECNIHPWMKGYLIIRSDLYAGVSDENGVIVINNLPTGALNFRAWCERILEDLKVEGADASWKKGRFTARIEDGIATEINVTVSADKILRRK
jgi:hypothetical protein